MLAAALVLVACTKDPAFRDAGGITVEASIGPLTKVATTGAASSLETGDRIAVYAWTGSATAVPAERVVDGIVNTLGGDGKWTPASQMRWKVGSDAHYFLGVSPVRAISDFTADAFALSGVYATDDLLVARKLDGVKPGSGAVALSFAHAMAQLTVNVKVRNEFGASPAVSVSVSAKSGATVNYLTQAVTATGDASALSLTAAASAPSGYTHSFSGIQVPQTGVRTITLTVAGKEFVYEAAEDIPLTSGHHTTLGLVLGKDRLELSGVSVSEWTAGTALSGGDASVTKINGHEFVDMGNGLLWATCNVGAENPWDYGDYFAWGETTTKATYIWSTYIWGDGTTFTKYTVDGTTVLEAADDAATANWGGNWRTPTDAEWTWLRENCDWEWTGDYLGDGSNKAGRIVTSPINGNQIFLPAAGFRGGASLYGDGSYGYYWSSSLYESSSNGARYVLCGSGGVGRNYDSRYYGKSVRPVVGDPLLPPALGDLYYSDGTWSPTLIEGKTPIGVIAYLDQLDPYDDEISENGTIVGGSAFEGHGLVLCLKNAASHVKWSTEEVSKFPGQEVTNVDGLKRKTSASGYTNTATLTSDAETAAKYPAAAAARNYTDLPAPAGSTGWFLPSAQQLVRIQESLGGVNVGDITWDGYYDTSHSGADKWEAALAKAGEKGTAYDSVNDAWLWYWTSSEEKYDFAMAMIIDATGTGMGYGFAWEGFLKGYQDDRARVRPVLAF